LETDQGESNMAKKQVLVLLMLLGLLFSGEIARGQALPPTIQVTVNQSEFIRLVQKAKRASLTQPQIAEVVVITPTQLLINGKGVGKTSLVVWDERGDFTKIEITVIPDVASLRRQLKALFPLENIELSSSGPAIVLKGEVSNEVVYDKVLRLAQSYLPPELAKEVAPVGGPSQTVTVKTSEPRLPRTGTAFAGGGVLAFKEEAALTDADRWSEKRRIPGIIDLLVVREFRMIQVDVIVAEISLTKARELGIDFAILGRNTSFLSLAGSQAGFSSGSLFVDPSTLRTVTFGGGTSAIINHVSDQHQIATLYRLFQNRDVTEILAKPNLVIKNGRSGGFLAGGEFPVAIATSDRIDIEFKPFGVRLDFLPTITWSNTIDLRIFPEVSEIDPTVSLVVGNVSVPGLRVRRSVSRVEMKEGETLILSGLLDRRVIKSLTKFPILGDIPYLGALFRSTRFKDTETELVFLITPTIVRPMKVGQKPRIPSIEKYDDPDMRQIPLPTPPDSSEPGGATIP